MGHKISLRGQWSISEEGSKAPTVCCSVSGDAAPPEVDECFVESVMVDVCIQAPIRISPIPQAQRPGLSLSSTLLEFPNCSPVFRFSGT